MIPRFTFIASLSLACAMLMASPSRAHAADPLAIAHYKADIQPMIAQLCQDCHGNGLKKGKIAFDELNTDQAMLNRELWWKVLKNVRAGIMPPSDEPRPTPEQIKKLETWIKRDVFGIDPNNPDPGRVTIRRLNRTEYRNTIRDLMGVDFRADEEFPPDDTGYGFDNIGDVLSISPMLLEKYMSAAEVITAQAVPLVNKVVQERTLTGAQFMRGGARGAGANLNFRTPRVVSQTIKIDEPGEYRILVDLTVNGSFDFDSSEARVAFKIDGQELFHDNYRWQGGKKYEYTHVVKWEPGDRELAFDLQPTNLPTTQPEEMPQQQGQGQGRGNAPRTSVDMRIGNVKVQGPLDQSRWKAPPNYSRFFTRPAAPTADPERRQYAREVLTKFATRAFRRPVDEKSVDRLVGIAEGVYTQPGKPFEQGIAYAMTAVLASPRFIFRVEEPLAAEAQQPWGLIDEYALATRLSYFLWSTMPDDRLMNLAKAGELRKNMESEVKRMLADDKSDAMVDNFTGQWLEARDIDGISIDARTVLARDAGQEAQLKREEEEIRIAQAEAAANRGRGRRGGQQQQQQQQIAQPDAQQQVLQQANQQQQAQPQANQQQAPQAVAQPDQPQQPAAQGQPQAQQQAQADPNQQPAARGDQPAAGRGDLAQGRGRGQRGGRGRGNIGQRPPPAVELTRDLRRAMREETQMYFAHILREDRTILELIDSNYTFANEALAKHYGIPDVTGPEMRKVELPADSPRGGVLTQATVLIVTSNSTRTSPVKRGLFVLDNILGTPAPPAPDDIPPLEDTEKQFGDREPTMRESMQIHREKALCAACHLRMDALGLALENFNALGMWRNKERNQDIDASGQLITGEKLSGLRDLKNVLKNERRMDFYRCMAEKLLTYALGRGLQDYDTEAVDRIIDRLNKNEGRFSALLMGVIESASFQARRNISAPMAQAPEQP